MSACPCTSSSKNAAHICKDRSLNPNSKNFPVIVGYALSYPTSLWCQSLRPPGLVRQVRTVFGYLVLYCAESSASNSDVPCIAFTRRNAFRGESHWESLAIHRNFAKQNSIVPVSQGTGWPRSRVSSGRSSRGQHGHRAVPNQSVEECGLHAFLSLRGNRRRHCTLCFASSSWA